jgi:hypothetical protein
MKIALTIKEDGSFNWDVTTKGQTQTLTGEAGFADGVLTLAQNEGPPLAGKVDNVGAKGFGFKLLGGANAPALAFTR